MEESGQWTFKKISGNIYKVYITVSPHGIAQTGSDVTKELHIPFAHRWLRIHFHHTDSSYVASGYDMRIILKRTAGTLIPQKFEETLFEDYKVAIDQITEVFGEGFEYEAGLYNLTTRATNTHYVFPVFYIQKLSEA